MLSWSPLLTGLLLSPASPRALATGTHDPATHFFGETWGDLQEELAIARREGLLRAGLPARVELP